MTDPCFHCGLPVADGIHFPIRYRQSDKPACCAGCQAVAQTIIDAGLDGYYEHRTLDARRAEPLPTELVEQIRLYDAPELQHSFVHAEGDLREASLILEGITCAACVWLNEQHLKRQPGVISVDVNYASHRARVKWDSTRIQLSALLEAIAQIGYRAHPYDADRREKLAEQERKGQLNRLWVAGLSMMQVMMYAVPVYLDTQGEMSAEWMWLLHWASFFLTLPVVLYSAWPFYVGTWRDLRNRRAGMDVPVTVGVLTSFVASSWALFNHIDHGIYFDSVSMFVFLLLGGRYLEGMARRRAGDAGERLVKLIPAFTQRVADWPADRDTHMATVASVRPGEVLLVRPGETVPVDGEVLDGHSSVDESLLTGESLPQPKQSGDTLIAGSVNVASPLYLRATHTGESTRLAGIVRLLDQAMSERPRLAVLADRVSAWFVTTLLLVAVLTYAGWYMVDPERALWIMVAVLVISCPCALSLATPAALTAASGTLAGRGVLLARGMALESLAQITDAVFDKTGTLTWGDMQLKDQLVFDARVDALALAQGLEAGSEHPLARALLAAGGEPLRCTGLHSVAGQGVEGEFAGHRYRLGKPAFVATVAGEAPDALAGFGGNDSVIALGDAGGWIAAFAIGDRLRDDAAAVIAALRARGIRTHLASGDRAETAAAVAATLGIDQARGGMTPEDKLACVTALQQQGRHVLMVGDGVNDAPVLARADVSAAMGSGTDVARLSGDLVLVGNGLSPLVDALGIARRTRRIIRQNLVWAVGYNLVALPLAIGGWITPWIASLGMALSSLLVVGNALRLSGRTVGGKKGERGSVNQ